MVSQTDPTVLRITTDIIPPYSSRGLTQTLQPIDQASQNKRTVNGKLVDTSFSGFHKYASQITGNDQMPPAIDGVWPGLQIVVDCVSELSYKTIGGAPARTVVTDSSYVEGLFTFYRPRLTMRVMNFSIQRGEYDRVIGWSLDLEEV